MSRALTCKRLPPAFTSQLFSDGGARSPPYARATRTPPDRLQEHRLFVGTFLSTNGRLPELFELGWIRLLHLQLGILAPPDPAEYEIPDLAGLIADAIATGMATVRNRLRPLTPTTVGRIIEAEVKHRTIVLLREAHGDRVKAAELLAADWRRWHGR